MNYILGFLLVFLIFSSYLFFLHWRDLYFFYISRLVKIQESKAAFNSSILYTTEYIYNKSFILYRKKTGALKIADLVKNLPIKDRIIINNSFLYLYFSNEMIDDLILSIDNGLKITQDWIIAHPSQAEKSLDLLRKTLIWTLRQDSNNWNENQEDYFTRSREITFLDGWTVRDYRNLRVAKLLVEWSSLRGHEPLRRAIKHFHYDPNPLMFQFMSFNFDLANAMGMDIQTFDDICRQAEILPISEE